ncbi:hypothetical protein KCMC57_up59010 [Kitasatospora sp. CMC57]|uniref:Transposase n=1 Tax=Kitasatospora sp. CMC57 TaxID=3231513 RepID=A0AB33K1W9_9ACTN
MADEVEPGFSMVHCDLVSRLRRWGEAFWGATCPIAMLWPVVCRRSSKDADWLVEWAGTHRPVVGVKRAGVRMLAFMRIDGLLLWTGG